jgi:uncharacterized protein (DUF169 family)
MDATDTKGEEPTDKPHLHGGVLYAMSPRVELTGSLCHSAIAYPAVTGNTNATFGDWTARRVQNFATDVAFVSVPYERMHNLVAAIPHSSAGTAEVVIPPFFQHEMDD